MGKREKIAWGLCFVMIVIYFCFFLYTVKVKDDIMDARVEVAEAQVKLEAAEADYKKLRDETEAKDAELTKTEEEIEKVVAFLDERAKTIEAQRQQIVEAKEKATDIYAKYALSEKNAENLQLQLTMARDTIKEKDYLILSLQEGKAAERKLRLECEGLCEEYRRRIESEIALRVAIEGDYKLSLRRGALSRKVLIGGVVAVAAVAILGKVL